MEQYHGKSIYTGIAIGKLQLFSKEKTSVIRRQEPDSDTQIRRYEQAKEKVAEALLALRSKTAQQAGETQAQIFDAYAMILQDEDFTEYVTRIIRRQKLNAEFAVYSGGEHFVSLLEGKDSDYVRQRSEDIRDVTGRIVDALLGVTFHADMEEPVILMAEDLTPTQIVQMDKARLLAFVLCTGSAYSHSAILARTMGIPALTGIRFDRSLEGHMAVVDGHTGTLIVDPSKDVLSSMIRKQAQENRENAIFAKMKGKETVTLGGKKISLYANIGHVDDVTIALSNDAEGIGLFRSEFLYLGAEDYPTEEQQFTAYKTVAEHMAGKKVIIRTLDIGDDKQADYFHLPKENNPAMGLRAIRICLQRPEIFKQQLRAIYRAAAYGNVAVMFPMITSVEEVIRIKEIMAEVETQLKEWDTLFKVPQMGVMIETPAAAVISDLLAKEVDFFSIGTNDLAQFTLAVDRQSDCMDEVYRPDHEAVLRLVKMVIDNGHAAGITVGICGELGGNPEMTKTLVAMGVDELSVTPSRILPLRKAIREIE